MSRLTRKCDKNVFTGNDRVASMAEDPSLELKKVRDQATLLYEISKVVVSNRYLEEVLTMIVGLTAQLTGSKICSMMILDERKQELKIRASQSLSEAYRNKPPIKVGESVSGRVVQLKKPISVLNVYREKDYRYPEIAKAEGVVSLAAIPMMTKDRVIGVLNCYTAEEHAYSEEELNILAGVANQAAMAIDNTKLLEEKVAAYEQLEARKTVAQAKRIMMKRQGLSEDEAYRLMQKKSMDMRRSLKEIAQAIILNDEITNTSN